MSEMWFYTSEGKQMAPVTLVELKRFIGDGVVKPTDMVWKEGMPRWMRASTVKDLFPDSTAALDPYIPQPAKSVEPATSAVPASTKSSPQESEAPQPLKRQRRSADAEYPSSRGRASSTGGSNAGIFIALFLGGGVLLIALIVGVVILIGVNQPPAQAEPEIIKGSTSYTVQLNNGERQRRVFSFRKDAKYEIRVRTQQRFVDVDLYIRDMNGLEMMSDIRPDADCDLDWIPPQDGQFQVEVHNCPPQMGGGGVNNSTVTIREVPLPPQEVKKILPKEPPVPEGVLVGKSFKNLDQVPLGQPCELRMRVLAGHKAKVFISSAPNLKFRLIVLKDGEDKEIARSTGTGVQSLVEIQPFPANEIVRVRVENITGNKSASSLCTVHYDLGK